MSYKPEVHKRIAVGISILAALYGAAFFVLPPVQAIDSASRLLLAAKLLGFIPLPLLAGVWATVFVRYSDASLIQGYKAAPSERLALLHAYNANTLEQTALHALSIVAFCAVVPQRLLVFAMAQVAAFLLGRLLFFLGYRRAPLKRLVGFVLGFYSAVAAIVTSCAFALAAI